MRRWYHFAPSAAHTTPHAKPSRYVKQARFDANTAALLRAWGGIVLQLIQDVGKSEAVPGDLHLAEGTYHVTHCSSPEYKCYPPFEDRACKIGTDCNYELSQLRWGLTAVLRLGAEYNLSANLTAAGVDVSWWQALLDGKLVWVAWVLQHHIPIVSPHFSGTLMQNCLATSVHVFAVLVCCNRYYPLDDATGFRLDANCSFNCPHRHFSHLLQIFDLQTVE